MPNSIFLTDGVPFSGQMVGPAADNTAAPPFTFLNDLNTGYASSAADTLDLVTGGTSRFKVSTTAITSTLPMLAADGSAAAPSRAYTSEASTGTYFVQAGRLGISLAGAARAMFTNSSSFGFQIGGNLPLSWSSAAAINSASDLFLMRDAANTLAMINGTATSQTMRFYGYSSGSRLTRGGIQTITGAVTLSGATTATSNIIPAGATVINVATSTTTTITGASGYQVGDGSDADRWGDITGTAVGTASGSADGTADPTWWSSAERAITLTAKTSNFTGGVVQVTVFYLTTTGA